MNSGMQLMPCGSSAELAGCGDDVLGNYMLVADGLNLAATRATPAGEAPEHHQPSAR